MTSFSTDSWMDYDADVLLTEDQVFWTYPCRSHDSDSSGKLEYTVENPFVHHQRCSDCDSYPCWCPNTPMEMSGNRYECRLCHYTDISRETALHHLRDHWHKAKFDNAEREREWIMEQVRRYRTIHNAPGFQRLTRPDAPALPDAVLAAAKGRYVS